MSVGKLKEFDLSSGKWSIYCEIVEQYFLANDTAAEKRIPTLLASVGTATYELMVDLCSPKKPKELKYEELIALVAAHIEPRPSYLAERYTFRLTKQAASESVAQFAATLKHLATTCDFKNTLDDNPRDQFICGLNSDATRQRLFIEENGLDFKRAYRVALSLESAARNAAIVEQTPSGSTEHALHAVHATPGYGRGGGGARFPRRGGAGHGGAGAPTAGRGRGAGSSTRPTRGAAGQLCRCCGDRGHDHTGCRFKDYVCKICLNKGHLKKACPNIRDMNYTSNADVPDLGHGHDDDSNEDWDEDPEEQGETGGSAGLYHVELTGREPVMAEIEVEGKILHMHVDTGSPYACISENLYRKMFGQYTLRQDDIKLRGYDGGLIRSLGYIKVNVKYLNVIRHLNLYVIINGGVPLLGREWLKSLGMNVIASNSLLKIEKSDKCSDVLDKLNLMRDHARVFREGLGRHASARAELRVRPGARPVFRRARPLPLALRAPVDAELERMEHADSFFRLDFMFGCSCQEQW